MNTALSFLLLAATVFAHCCGAAEELITSAQYPDGEIVPYILNTAGPNPKYVIILFPGGTGLVNPRMEEGKLVYAFKGNFLVRARDFFVDTDFATITTNASDSEARIQALLDDIERRFPGAKVYLAGTSNGTSATLKLAGFLQDKIAGAIHTASRAQIYFFDAKAYRNRHLVVHHVNDWCRGTPFNAALRSHKRYGNDFIAMEGGISVGSECEAFAHHGFHAIERETAPPPASAPRSAGRSPSDSSDRCRGPDD